MAEAAGLGIGVASLAFELFSGCVKGYRLILGAIDMPKTSGHLLVRLQMEKDKLIGWAMLAGISEEETQLKPSMRFNRHTMVDTLKEIQTLLLDLARLRRQYKLELNIAEGSTQAEAEQPVNQTGGNAANATDDPVLDRYSRLEKRALEFFEKTRQVPRKLKWSALDNDKFEELLANLGKLNDGMMVFLEPYDREQLLKRQEITLMQVLQVSTKVDDLLGLLHSQEAANADNRHRRQHMFSDNSRQTYAERFERLTRFRALNLNIEHGGARQTSSISPRSEYNSRISRDGLELEDPVQSQTLEQFSSGRYQGQSVWVEWRYYEPHVEQCDDEDDEDIQDSREPPPFVHSRIARMADLLRGKDKPPEFCVPDCVGYVLDTQGCRLGLVYKPITPALGFIQPPVSLLDLFSERKKPSLTTRIQMGRLLASSIWYLHATQWLHKGLRSQNVVFETPVDFKSGLNSGTPRLVLCGFDYSRPAAIDETTESPVGNLWHELYRHPNAQFDFPVKAAGDSASWMWRPVHALLGIDTESSDPGSRLKASMVKTVRSRLLAQDSLEELEAQTGSLYAGCVKSCLSGDFTEEDNGSGEYGNESRLVAEFWENVLQKLESTCV
ncbi:uncharacterized protein PG986_003603 [Apiospora aurea]|uniref:Prion-inhibition and propagation HeLo domain-containing protein n=1 Tax=Apiospora aurea TaxID=335848 RepID=A0ABR1QS59_9PEZI